LALAEQLAQRERRWYWLALDIKDAFPSVPRNRLLDIFRRYVPNGQTAELAAQVISTDNPRGIPQGQPLCPLLLNLYLHHLLDKPWQKRSQGVPLLRVADDLLILGRDGEETQWAHKEVDRLLRPTGMLLKQADPQGTNLAAGQQAAWLGFRLRMAENQLQVRMTNRHWQGLETKLQRCHLEPNAPCRATRMVQGWLEQLGPVYEHEDRNVVLEELVQAAQRQAFQELPGRRQLLHRWEMAHLRWEGIRDQLHRRM
jgi:hypothetical protein